MHERAGADQRVLARCVIELRSVALTPMKQPCADADVARDDDVGADEAVVLDGRVVADVVAAPERDVVADRDERLHRVVLEDEAVVAGRMLASGRCSG